MSAERLSLEAEDGDRISSGHDARLDISDLLRGEYNSGIQSSLGRGVLEKRGVIAMMRTRSGHPRKDPRGKFKRGFRV